MLVRQDSYHGLSYSYDSLQKRIRKAKALVAQATVACERYRNAFNDIVDALAICVLNFACDDVVSMKILKEKNRLYKTY